jgi:hypothetical protein
MKLQRNAVFPGEIFIIIEVKISLGALPLFPGSELFWAWVTCAPRSEKSTGGLNSTRQLRAK